MGCNGSGAVLCLHPQVFNPCTQCGMQLAALPGRPDIAIALQSMHSIRVQHSLYSGNCCICIFFNPCTPCGGATIQEIHVSSLIHASIHAPYVGGATSLSFRVLLPCIPFNPCTHTGATTFTACFFEFFPYPSIHAPMRGAT